MSEISLKPCPFCGGRNADTSYQDAMRGDFRRGVYCPDCGGGIYPFEDTEAEAIAAWNTRVERTCKPKRVPVSFDRELWPGVTEMHRLVCSECGCADLGMSGVNYCPNCGAKVVEA